MQGWSFQKTNSMHTLDELQQLNSQLREELEIVGNINKELTLEIESLKSIPVVVQQSSLISHETFEHEGIVYGFVYPGINYKGEVITADHILASKNLQEELVKIKSGMLKKIS